jgi:hypothetical protein
MSEIDVFVWHDSDGKITAVGVPHPDMVGKVQSIARSGHGAVCVRVPEEHLKRLHETHQIDVERGVVTPRRRAERP